MTELQFAVEAHKYPPTISVSVLLSEVPKRLRSRKFIRLEVRGTKKEVITFPIEVLEEKEGVS